MRAARLHEHATDPDDALRVEEVPEPTVSGPKDVVVEIEGAGWCRTDNKLIEGVREANLPITLGHENAGVVHEVGVSVEAVDPGDAVVCHPRISCGECRRCRAGNDVFCENRRTPGIHVDGGFAEYLRTAERSVIPLDSADPVEVVPCADAGLTSYRVTRRAGEGLTPDEFAVIVGVGGLGHIGVQLWSVLNSSPVIAVDVKAEALELADALGADHCVDASEDDVASRIRSIAGERDVSRIVDFVGVDDTVAWGSSVLSPGGKHFLVGYAGSLDLSASDLPLNELSLIGSRSGTYNELRELVALADRGKITIHTQQFGLDRITDVAHMAASGEILGRAVIVP